MKKEVVTSSRAPSADISITGIDIRSNLDRDRFIGSAISNESISRKLSDNVILNVKEKEKIKKIDKQSQRLAIELAEYSNNLESLSVSVKSSHETLIKNKSQKTKQVKNKMKMKSKNDDKIKPLNEESVNEYSKQTNFSDNIVRPQSENHARELNHKIAAESQKEKESWLVPGFGFIAVMVLLIGIILGFLGAFGGNSLVNFENSNLYI